MASTSASFHSPSFLYVDGKELTPYQKKRGEIDAALPNGRAVIKESCSRRSMRISSGILGTTFDVLLLPFAGGLVVQAACKKSFDPKMIKQNKTPILLLHGSGFNQSEWLVARRFLDKAEYGSVFSLNYAGLVSNEDSDGVDDYAKGPISKKIEHIKKLTNQNEVILIGHSMGGLIAGQYAQTEAAKSNTQIKHIITIATPWKGAPALKLLKQEGMSKRYKQMTVKNEFLLNLCANSLKLEREGVCNFYNIDSDGDLIVPSPHGLITENPDRSRTYRHLGHYALVASPSVWRKVTSWLDEINTGKKADVRTIERRVRKTEICEGIVIVIIIATVIFAVYSGVKSYF